MRQAGSAEAQARVRAGRVPELSHHHPSAEATIRAVIQRRCVAALEAHALARSKSPWPGSVFGR
jgi:hypothetical protein